MLREAGLHYSRAILLLWDRTWKANSERGIARITWMDAKRSFHNMSTCNDPTVCRDCDSCTYDLAVCWAPDLDGEVPEVLSTDLLSGAGYVRFS